MPSFKTVLVIILILVIAGYGPQVWHFFAAVIGFIGTLSITVIFGLIILALLIRGKNG